jgi:hypothetical protein
MIRECLKIDGTADKNLRLAIEELARDSPFMIRMVKNLYDINIENKTDN